MTQLRRSLVGALIVGLSHCAAYANPTANWSATKWHGEEAWVAESDGWRAIVSRERGRLVQFGPADSDANLLFAPDTKDDPNGWGGHRVWLGPQAEWPGVWPPDEAWERSAPESVSVSGSTVELVMRDSWDGWPRLARVYSWHGDELACTVKVHGGRHDAQVIQILQIHANATVRVEAASDAATPEGFVVLQIGQKDQVRRTFSWPAGATREGQRGVLLRPRGVVEKLAFVPQPLRASLLGCELVVALGETTGRVVGEVDDGFTTQVYLGRTGVPFLELEQLTPRFAAGGDGASATILLRATRTSK